MLPVSFFKPEYSELEKIVERPINGIELKRWNRNSVEVMHYSKLAAFRSIEGLLSKTNAVCILLKSKTDFGHWMCIKRVVDPETNAPIHRTPADRGIISFFDSYGKFPDSQKARLNPKFLTITQQSEDHILRLFRDALSKGYALEYSEYPLQLYSPSVATCGRWCSLFIHFKEMNVDEFNAFIKEIGERLGLKPDYVCALLYLNYDPDN